MGNSICGNWWQRNSFLCKYKCFSLFTLIYVVLLAVVFIIVEIAFSMNPNSFLPSSDYSDLKDTSFFAIVPNANITKTELITQTRNDYLCTFSICAIIVYIVSFVLSLAIGVVNDTIFNRALTRHCMIFSNISNEIKKTRKQFLDRWKIEVKQPIRVPEDEYGLHSVTVHSVMSPMTYEVKANVHDFIFHEIKRNHLYLDAVLWLHDLVKAVDFIHSQHFYHLNLQPQTVFIHWFHRKQNIPMRFVNTVKKVFRGGKSDYPASRVILGDMSNAVNSENGKVSANSVAVPEHYMPPECVDNQEVDGVMVDAWCIGIIAYEIFTGGCLTISANPGTPVENILPQLLSKKYFMNALWSFHDIRGKFKHLRLTEQKIKTYHLDQTEFSSDCWNFVSRLLESDPNKRMSLKRALEMPLLNKVRRDINDTYYVNYSF